MDTVRINVETPSRGYPVTIAGGAIEGVGRALDDLGAPRRRFIVSSPLVWRLHGGRLAHLLNAGEQGEPILVPDGERFKQLSTVARIYDALVRANAELEQFVRQFAKTVYHPVGTCRMGSDAQAVVDPQLRVRGVQRLRVCDASVMPSICSGNTNAPTIMIAERGAEFMLGR